ncbi:ABC transporter substrate-binding protein [Paenibacillus sp. GCM10027627]|uniref:ABC transporter substrate-binding protein n=1 Tax=unclassified Paenibacillus TaxID=185978 RepID=UPI003630428D
MGKAWKTFFVLILLAGLMAGCTDGLFKKENKTVTLKVFATTTQEFSKYKALIEEQFPDVTLEVFPYYSALQSASLQIDPYSTRETPDVRETISKLVEQENPDLYFNFDPTLYSEQFKLVNLAEPIRSNQLELNAIQSQMLNWEVDFDKEITQISPTFDKKVLYINKSIFDRLDVPVPTTPMTWEQFRQTAALIKEKDNKVTGYLFDEAVGLSQLVTEAARYNGLPLTDNEGKLAIDSPLWKEVASDVMEDLRSGVTSYADDRRFLVHWSTSAMFIADLTEAKDMVKKQVSTEFLQLADLPAQGDQPQPSPYRLTRPFSIDLDSKHIEQAWNIIQFLISEEGAKRMDEKSIKDDFVAYPQYAGLGDFPVDILSSKPFSYLSSHPKTKMHKNSVYEASSLISKQLDAFYNGGQIYDHVWDNLMGQIQNFNSDSSKFVAVSGH